MPLFNLPDGRILDIPENPSEELKSDLRAKLAEDFPEEYGENAGETLDFCLVMPSRWDADPSKSDLDAILNAVSADPPQFIGYAEGFCPSLRSVTGPD